MTSRKVQLGVLSATVVLTAAGYQSATSAAASITGPPLGNGATGSVSQSAAPTPSPSESPYSEAAVPNGWKKIGSPVNGFSVAIPKGWTDIDLTAADLKERLDKAGIKGLTQESLQQLEGVHALYAVDSAGASSGFPTNFNGFCQNVTRSIQQMKDDVKAQLTQIGATNLDITDTTVAGHPAVRIDYTLKADTGLVEGVQVQIPVTGGKTCVLTITAQDGSFPSSADQILGTFTTL